MEDRRSQKKMVSLEVYTDGSLKKMGQTMTFGGWGFIVLRDTKRIYARSGGENHTTNQRMELTAAIEALKYVSTIRKHNEQVVIYSDSAYLINCYLKEWYINWQANGWTNASGQEVANQDLWAQLIPYFDNFWYIFRKVPGHAKVEWNEQCDALAQREAKILKDSWRGEKNEHGN